MYCRTQKESGVFDIADFPGPDGSEIAAESEIGCPGICRA